MNSLRNEHSDAIRNSFIRRGILKLEPFPKSRINQWNHALDEPFAKAADKNRSYILAKELLDLGILQDAFTPALRAVVRSIDPTSVFFHCHAYEIAGVQRLPHIADGENDGWHRDIDVPPQPSDVGTDAFSVFIYLSNVSSAEDGAFEILPSLLQGNLRNGLPTVAVLGEAGHTFLWNRSLYHRASANRSCQRRRVLKFSFQSRKFSNAHAERGEFTNAAAECSDPFLSFLLGSQMGINTLSELPSYESALARFFQYESNSRVRLSIKSRIKALLLRRRDQV